MLFFMTDPARVSSPVILSPLLGPEYSPPFEVLNPTGRASAVLVCDHASNAIPQSLNNLGLGPAELAQHIAWDVGAAEITRLLSKRFDAPAVLSGFSRLLIDHNRAPGDPQSIQEVSDGIVIPGNQNLSDAEAEWRLETFFWPYHHVITNTLAHLWRHGRAPALISIHSFTPQLNGGPPRPWHIGILWNRDPRMAGPIMERLKTYPDICVGDNEPYSGREVGYTMETHAGAAGLPHVEFEFRHDLISDREGCERWGMIAGDVLETLLADPSLYCVTHY